MGKFLILTAFILNLAFANERHVQMGATLFKESSKQYLAVTLKNDKGWHTYWKNPGDAGIPVKFDFFINNKKIKLNDLEWPVPKKYIEQGEILAYGYSDTNHFYFEIPNELESELKNNLLTIKGTWLVCKDICIPGEDSISLQVHEDISGVSHPYPINISELKEKLRLLPQEEKIPAKLEIYLTKSKEDNMLALQYTFSDFDITTFNGKNNLLTPFPAAPFDYKREKLFWDAKNKTLYGRIYISWDGIYEDPQWPLPEDGIFKKPIIGKFILNYSHAKKPIIIEHSFQQFSMTGDESLEQFFSTLKAVDENGKELNVQHTLDNTSSIFTYFFFAFIGGLILNLMPCVLPVISLKLFGLIIHSDEPKNKILKHNFSYAAGVLFSFMVLAFIVLILKSGGEKIGWGFQLQSPGFVFSMMIVIFVMTLNMFGLFEFVTPGGKTLGNTQIKQGLMGDFINGILATVLSTPCSAPFLGTALTFAFTTSHLNLFIILFFVGLGLAFPFIMTGIFPSLVSNLPRPGIWMDKLKYLLGFTLLITFIWLYDVLANIIDFSFAGIYINTIFATIFFAFFLRRFVTKIFFWNVILFICPVILTTLLVKNNGLVEASSQNGQIIKTSTQLNWKKWSEEQMQELAEQKKWVFIDFTAKWCLTCKVNKKLVLDTQAFQEFVKEKQIHLLLADWTKRDDYITDFLRKYNIVGVPAYFIQTPNGEIVFLGETISISEIKKIIK